MQSEMQGLNMYAIKTVFVSLQNCSYLGRWLATALIIPNPFQYLLFRSCALGILPLSRHDYLGCSNKRSYKKSIVSGERYYQRRHGIGF